MEKPAQKLSTGKSLKTPSVNSVTYGVCYGFQIHLVYKAQTDVQVPKGAK